MVRPLSALVPTRDYAESVLGKIKLAAFHFYMDTGYALLSWILAGKEPGFARVELVDTIPPFPNRPLVSTLPPSLCRKDGRGVLFRLHRKKAPPTSHRLVVHSNRSIKHPLDVVASLLSGRRGRESGPPNVRPPLALCLQSREDDYKSGITNLSHPPRRLEAVYCPLTSPESSSQAQV